MKMRYDFVWASDRYLSDALDRLREYVGKHTEKGWELLGGASLTRDSDGRFYVMQTLIKKED